MSTLRRVKGTIGVSQAAPPAGLRSKVLPVNGKEDQDWDWKDRTPLYSQATGVPHCRALVGLLARPQV